MIGPDGEEWRFEIERDGLPRSCDANAIVFGNNGFGDLIYLEAGRDEVMVWRHEGEETSRYCDSVLELHPDYERGVSQIGPVQYAVTGQDVRLGDRVRVRYWLIMRGAGTVVYVPGISKMKPEMERDGLTWVRVRMDGGFDLDTVVIDGKVQRSVRLLGRADASQA